MSFKRLDPEDFLLSAESITAPAWSTQAPVLNEMQTSSVQDSSNSGNYYLNVFQTGSNDSTAAVQFDVAFGDKSGRGNTPYTTGLTPSTTSTIYGQYHNLVIGDENSELLFNGVSQSAFYAISIDRNRYKEKLLPGTFNLRLRASAESDNQLFLTDNSRDISTVQFSEAGRVFQVVSGSNGSAISSDLTADGAIERGQTVSGSYGLFLPDIGVILLNATALDNPVDKGGIALGTDYGTTADGKNNGRLFTALSQSAHFQLNSEETVSSDYIFVRARNSEFNYSENPSFISGSQGTVIYDDFINNPQTFLTTVGLYNDNSDLLAVAKLSQPLKKDFTKEALVRVKLDF